MSHSFEERIVALAGVSQAISAVDKLATTGILDTHAFEVAVNSLFNTQPSNTLAVYGELKDLMVGFELLCQLLSNHRSSAHANPLRYCMSVLHLQKKLANNNAMLAKIAEGLKKAQFQSEHFGATHDNVVSNLAQLYTETLSTYSFRIQVVGHYQYLQQDRVADQVRVLLFAAIRSAMLWRQVGGSRWQLLLHRKALLNTAEDLLKDAKNQQ